MTASNVLMLLGAIVTASGLLRIWIRNSDIRFGWPGWARKLGGKLRQWLRFGRPVHHTGDGHLAVNVELTAEGFLTAKVKVIRTEAERLEAVEQAIQALAEQHARRAG